jgi:hypothetical protein
MDGRIADAFHEANKALTAFAASVSCLKEAITDELDELPDNPNPAIAKLRADLDWRGPNEKKAGHICLPREMAEQLLEWIDGKQGSL